MDEQLIVRLAGKAREGGLQLTGDGGLLAALTKRLVKSALEGEFTDHLGYAKPGADGRDGGNSRNGRRPKTGVDRVRPVEIDVPRDRDGSFEPKIVPKRTRRLSRVDEMVISLSAKGQKSGSPGALLRRGPLRTARAAFTASSSSKPRDGPGLQCCAPASASLMLALAGGVRKAGGFLRPADQIFRDGRGSQRLSPSG